MGSFASHKNQISGSAVRRDQRFFRPYPRRLESLTALADVIRKAALSSQLFKDPECWSGRDLNPRPPAQQTGALPTELTRQLFVRFFFLSMRSRRETSKRNVSRFHWVTLLNSILRPFEGSLKTPRNWLSRFLFRHQFLYPT